jgi:hypothetical protein
MNNLTPEGSQEQVPIRQCRRQKVELHFRLGGKDERGDFFEEEVITRDLSECGGSFVSTRPIQIGSTLSLADRTGFISMINITWGKVVDHMNTAMYGFRFLFPLED